jgi:hypothetical protein
MATTWADLILGLYGGLMVLMARLKHSGKKGQRMISPNWQAQIELSLWGLLWHTPSNLIR